MKVLAELGKLSTGEMVVMTDNKIQPFVVAPSYNPNKPDGDKWVGGVYFSSLTSLALRIVNREMSIGYDRMSEIASKAIDGLREDNEENCISYLTEDSDLDMTEEELEYFGLTVQQLDSEEELV